MTDLHAAMMGAVRAAPREQQLAFLRNHPDLAGKAARAGAITDDSQTRAGERRPRHACREEEFARFHRLNDAYKAKFGFPFMICVRRHTRDSILAQFERRLAHDEATEFAAALQEVFYITRLRIAAQGDGRGHARRSTAGSARTCSTPMPAGRPSAWRSSFTSSPASATTVSLQRSPMPTAAPTSR